MTAGADADGAGMDEWEPTSAITRNPLAMNRTDFDARQREAEVDGKRISDMQTVVGTRVFTCLEP
jgi:hypothetical protein